MIDTDTQYEAYRIEGVDISENYGWTLRLEGSCCIGCPDTECQQAPVPGETARLYGKGFGYRVRGIAIDGRVYRYQTPAEDETAHAAWCAESERQRNAAAERHKAEIEEGAHAPVAFRIREAARADYEKGLAANTDPYGRACYLYAADWASLMEAELRTGGKVVADVAKSSSSAADKKHGVTGFMYGCAVSILSHCWEHGEELRRWHNLDTQAGTEGERANESGGVLNPAVMSIG